MKPGFESWHGWPLAAFFVAALCAACANGAGNSPGAGGASDTLPSDSVSCVNDARIVSYEEGLERTGVNGTLRFRFEKSEPGPPVRGDNTFTLSVSTVGGEAVSGDLGVTLRMPGHGHESPTVPTITFDAASATYTVAPANLFMAGVWQVTLFAYAGAAEAGAPVDSASFYFCVDG